MDVPAHDNAKFNYVLGLINLAVVFFVTWVLWYLFMHPNGTMKLYTPMYGFCLVTMLLCSVVALSKVIDFGLDDKGGASIGKGIALTVLAVILMLFVTYGVFRNFIGRYGVAYFSPSSIIAVGGTGAEPFNAREISSTAIIYTGAAFLWWALAWNVGFKKWPWQSNSKAVLSWSRFLAVMFLTIITYAVLFHPHVCYLFYPAQDKAGVATLVVIFCRNRKRILQLGIPSVQPDVGNNFRPALGRLSMEMAGQGRRRNVLERGGYRRCHLAVGSCDRCGSSQGDERILDGAV